MRVCQVKVFFAGIGPDFIEGWKIDFDFLNQSAAINREMISLDDGFL